MSDPESMAAPDSPPPECPRCGRAECAALREPYMSEVGVLRRLQCDGEPVDWRQVALSPCEKCGHVRGSAASEESVNSPRTPTPRP